MERPAPPRVSRLIYEIGPRPRTSFERVRPLDRTVGDAQPPPSACSAFCRSRMRRAPTGI